MSEAPRSTSPSSSSSSPSVPRSSPPASSASPQKQPGQLRRSLTMNPELQASITNAAVTRRPVSVSAAQSSTTQGSPNRPKTEPKERPAPPARRNTTLTQPSQGVAVLPSAFAPSALRTSGGSSNRPVRAPKRRSEIITPSASLIEEMQREYDFANQKAAENEAKDKKRTNRDSKSLGRLLKLTKSSSADMSDETSLKLVRLTV
jgi:hypothetical protein